MTVGEGPRASPLLGGTMWIKIPEAILRKWMEKTTKAPKDKMVRGTQNTKVVTHE